MDGDGMDYMSKKSAALCRQQAAAQNGDVWKDMTRDYHSFPDCRFTSREGTLEMMHKDVYSCPECWVNRTRSVPARWIDYPIEGGLGGLDWDACGNLRPAGELTRPGFWHYYWADILLFRLDSCHGS